MSNKPNRNAKSRRAATQRQNTQSVSKGTIFALVGLGVGLLAIVALIATGSGSESDDGSTNPRAFDLPSLSDSDSRIRLADFKGQPVVVNFFASWCTACDDELPGFAKVSRELEGEVAFIGINAQETGDGRLMPERHDITWWPLARDIGGRNGSGLHQALGGRGMPITAWYDAAGELVHVDGGAIPETTLRQRVTELFGIDTTAEA